MSGVLSGLIAAFPTPITSSFESIATYTGNGTTSTCTFSSIPGTYKHLQIRLLTANGSGFNQLPMTLNSDTGANYAQHRLFGNASTASAAGATSQTRINFCGQNPVTPYFGVSIIDIIDYASTSKYKTIRSFNGYDTNGTANQVVYLNSGLWMSTSAVTTITFTDPSGYNFATGTSIALYGIKG